MNFIEIKNDYRIVELTYDEVKAIDLLMEFMATHNWDDMPAWVGGIEAICEQKDIIKISRAFKNVVKQMDSDSPELGEVSNIPADALNHEAPEATIISINNERITLALNDIGAIFSIFSNFYFCYNPEDKCLGYRYGNLVPDREIISRLTADSRLID
jgi:hypothetical protein